MSNQTSLRLNELMFISIMSVVFGVIWSGYGFIYDIIAPILNMFGLSGLLRGIYILGCVFFPYIIRKPGSALMGEMIATIIESVFSGWGIEAVIFGLVQGLVAEAFFFFMRYRVWHRYVLIACSICVGLATFILSLIWYKYYQFGSVFMLVHLASIVVSSIVFSGFLSKYLADKLALTGVLNEFRLIKDIYR